jgi:hypothetical protein
VPDWTGASHEEDATVAGNEPVTSPDQRKPVNLRLVRTAAVVSAALIALMLIGNQKGRVELVWGLAIAGGIVLTLVIDWVLRRNGLRS